MSRRKEYYFDVFETLEKAMLRAEMEAEKIKYRSGIKIEIDKMFTGSYTVRILACVEG